MVKFLEGADKFSINGSKHGLRTWTISGQYLGSQKKDLLLYRGGYFKQNLVSGIILRISLKKGDLWTFKRPSKCTKSRCDAFFSSRTPSLQTKREGSKGGSYAAFRFWTSRSKKKYEELRMLSFTRNHQLGLNACQDFLGYLSYVLTLCLHHHLSLLPLLTCFIPPCRQT